MESTLFYVFGGALVLCALLVAWFGMRSERFPGGRGTIAAVTTLFAFLVIGTAAFGWMHASHEKEVRDEEIAKAEAEAGQESGKEGEATVVDLTSPEDGGLSYEPDGLEAAAGLIRLVYLNPSPLPHNIALEFEGETLAETEPISDGTVTIERRLQPGEYVYYCSVPGHREGGMEGDLLVTGPELP